MPTLPQSRRLVCMLTALLVAGSAQAAKVDEAAIRASEQDGSEWLSHGRTYAEQRFSPLK